MTVTDIVELLAFILFLVVAILGIVELLGQRKED